MDRQADAAETTLVDVNSLERVSLGVGSGVGMVLKLKSKANPPASQEPRVASPARGGREGRRRWAFLASQQRTSASGQRRPGWDGAAAGSRSQLTFGQRPFICAHGLLRRLPPLDTFVRSPEALVEPPSVSLQSARLARPSRSCAGCPGLRPVLGGLPSCPAQGRLAAIN